MGTDETAPSDFSTTKNPKPAIRKWVSPDAIRAERSEQEVAATTFLPEPGFLYSLRTAGQAGHGTRKPHILIAMSPEISDGACHCSACPTVLV